MEVWKRGVCGASLTENLLGQQQQAKLLQPDCLLAISYGPWGPLLHAVAGTRMESTVMCQLRLTVAGTKAACAAQMHQSSSANQSMLWHFKEWYHMPAIHHVFLSRIPGNHGQ